MPSDRPDTYSADFSLFGLQKACQHGSLPLGYLKAYLEHQRLSHSRAAHLISLQLAVKVAAPSLPSHASATIIGVQR